MFEEDKNFNLPKWVRHYANGSTWKRHSHSFPWFDLYPLHRMCTLLGGHWLLSNGSWHGVLRGRPRKVRVHWTKRMGQSTPQVHSGPNILCDILNIFTFQYSNSWHWTKRMGQSTPQVHSGSNWSDLVVIYNGGPQRLTDIPLTWRSRDPFQHFATVE